MKLSVLGNVQISVTPTAADHEIMSVDIIAENRKEGVSMTTNKDETVDQFVMRVKSMMRALINGEPRISEEAAAQTLVKPPTFEEQKAQLKAARK